MQLHTIHLLWEDDIALWKKFMLNWFLHTFAIHLGCGEASSNEWTSLLTCSGLFTVLLLAFPRQNITGLYCLKLDMSGDGCTEVFIVHIYRRVCVSALHIYSNQPYTLQLHPNTNDWHIFGPFRKPETIGWGDLNQSLHRVGGANRKLLKGVLRMVVWWYWLNVYENNICLITHTVVSLYYIWYIRYHRGSSW